MLAHPPAIRQFPGGDFCGGMTGEAAILAAEWWGEPPAPLERPPIIGVAGVSPATGTTGVPPVAVGYLTMSINPVFKALIADEVTKRR